jgi:hypothetical protein
VTRPDRAATTPRSRFARFVSRRQQSKPPADSHDDMNALPTCASSTMLSALTLHRRCKRCQHPDSFLASGVPQ